MKLILYFKKLQIIEMRDSLWSLQEQYRLLNLYYNFLKQSDMHICQQLFFGRLVFDLLDTFIYVPCISYFISAYLFIQQKMNGNSIPKRKKNTQLSIGKWTQSEQLLNKTTKRRTPNKKLSSNMGSKSTLIRSASKGKINKTTKKKKDKNEKTLSKGKLSTTKKKKQNQEDCKKTSKKFFIAKKQKEEQLTQRKKLHLEYFMYKDVCLPIQNTQQRKIIYKIKLIDQNAQKKQNKSYLKPIVTSDKDTSVVQAEYVDSGTQPSDRKKYCIDFQCQIQIKQQKVLSEQSESQKCFAQTLSQLQFLYLPDEKNFIGFSKSEKCHYKQLLLYLAKKFQQPDNTILDDQAVQMILKQRQLKQRGLTISSPEKGLPTHAPSIISYISNLFCYIEIHQKSSFIERMNCNYGYQLIDKFKRVRTGKSTKRPAFVIPETTFWNFQTQLHQGLEFQSETIEQALHAHNKSIFDTVNEVMQEFQPYYSSQGQPFNWSYNFETTFFFIAEQNFSALASQVKQKIWQYSSTLAGLIIDTPGQQRYKAHIKNLLIKQQQLLRAELKKNEQKVQTDEHRTRLLCEIGDSIQEQLIKQLALLLLI